jgi:hypothetical protein
MAPHIRQIPTHPSKLAVGEADPEKAGEPLCYSVADTVL